MRFLLAVLSLVIFIAILGAQDAPPKQPAPAQSLTLSGDVKEVEREKQITIKEKVQVVDLAVKPLVIEAPKGGVHYVWILPPNVTATKNGASIEITAAPRGKLDVSVSWIVIDFLNMKSVDGSASVCVQIGGFDPPVPSDPLAKELHGLFLADIGSDKGANVTKLAAVYRQAAQIVTQKNSTEYLVATASQLADAVRAVSKASLPVDALPTVRKRCNELVAESLADVDPDEPLTVEARTKAAELYAKIATALEQLK